MTRVKQVLDERRVKVLDALFTKGAIRPSFSLLQERTGLTRPTLVSSLAHLQEQTAIVQYVPALDWKKIGVGVESLPLLDFDFSQTEVLSQVAEWARSTPNVRFMGSIASGRYNLAFREMHRSMEAFQSGVLEFYQRQVPRAYPLIRDRAVYYFSEPVYAYRPSSRAAADIVIQQGPVAERKKIQLKDATRLSILGALFEPGALKPHLKTIQRATGMHLATISSSLDFLHQEGILVGYVPRLNPLVFDLKLFGFLLIQMPTVPKASFKKLVDFAKKDPHLLTFTSLAGTDYNLCMEFLHADINAFNRSLQKYYEAFPQLVSAPREIVYVTEPIYKNFSRSQTVLNILKKELGL
ncbi:Lrp/AsnC family transcriptional regulator [Candidatus Micrarchaeota archaeon]|nr:Lrp/AsnC family transcriptional regulator [Candidatus Micrarchaeota archaeon]